MRIISPPQFWNVVLLHCELRILCLLVLNTPNRNSQRGEDMAAEETASQQEMELPLVLLLGPLPRNFESILSKKFRFLKPWEEPSTPLHLFLTTGAQSVRAMLTRGFGCSVDAATLDCLPNLGLVVTTSTGLNHINLPECRRRGIAVANAGNTFSEDVADYAVALFIDVLRHVSASERYVRQRLWPQQGEYRPLGSKIRGKNVGIIGLGNIGSKIATRLEAFGCNIIYNSRTKKPVSFPYFSSILDLAARSDVIIVACPLTSETKHMINKDVLSALGKEGVIVNIGRGELIDEKELVRCLLQGEIAGAGLDVFENEPAVPEKLLAMDNVVLSPHRAILTQESNSMLLQVITGNLEAFFSNKPLLTRVKE